MTCLVKRGGFLKELFSPENRGSQKISKHSQMYLKKFLFKSNYSSLLITKGIKIYHVFNNDRSFFGKSIFNLTELKTVGHKKSKKIRNITSNIPL